MIKHFVIPIKLQSFVTLVHGILVKFFLPIFILSYWKACNFAVQRISNQIISLSNKTEQLTFELLKVMVQYLMNQTKNNDITRKFLVKLFPQPILLQETQTHHSKDKQLKG